MNARTAVSARATSRCRQAADLRVRTLLASGLLVCHRALWRSQASRLSSHSAVQERLARMTGREGFALKQVPFALALFAQRIVGTAIGGSRAASLWEPARCQCSRFRELRTTTCERRPSEGFCVRLSVGRRTVDEWLTRWRPHFARSEIARRYARHLAIAASPVPRFRLKEIHDDERKED